MKLIIPVITIMTTLLIACNNNSANSNTENKDTSAPAATKTETADTSTTKSTGDTLVKKSPVLVYTCPMHPEVIRKKAIKCPKCGMALVLKK